MFRTFACLAILLIGTNTQQCQNFAVFDYQNINGQLPTGITEELLMNGSNPRVGIQFQNQSGVITNPALTVNLLSFTVNVDESQTVVSSQRFTDQTTYSSQSNGTVTVTTQPVFTVFALFTQSDNTFFNGEAQIPCSFEYTFSVNSTFPNATYNYSLEYNTSVYNFTECTIQSLKINAFYPQNTQLLNALNDALIIQEALTTYYDNISLELNLITAINDFVPFQYFLTGQFDLNGDINYTTNFINTLVFLDYSLDSSLATYASANIYISNTTENFCGNVTNLTSLPSSSQMQFGTALIQSVFTYGLNFSLYTSELNFENWPVAYLPWFTGGWNQLATGIYSGFTYSTPIYGECITTNGSQWMGVSSTYTVQLNYNCTLYANSVIIQTVNVYLYGVYIGVNFNQNQFSGNYDAQMYIQSISQYAVNFSSTGTYGITNNQLADWFVNYAVNSLFVGQNIGQPIETIFPNNNGTPQASFDSNSNLIFTQ